MTSSGPQNNILPRAPQNLSAALLMHTKTFGSGVVQPALPVQHASGVALISLKPALKYSLPPALAINVNSALLTEIPVKYLLLDLHFDQVPLIYCARTWQKTWCKNDISKRVSTLFHDLVKYNKVYTCKLIAYSELCGLSSWVGEIYSWSSWYNLKLNSKKEVFHKNIKIKINVVCCVGRVEIQIEI